jgi:hypothetical protein
LARYVGLKSPPPAEPSDPEGLKAYKGGSGRGRGAAHETGARGLFLLTFQFDLRYSKTMKKSLLETNPYLKDHATRESTLARNVASSSAIEGIWVKRDAKSGCFVAKTKSDKAPTKSSKTSR